MTFRTRRCDHPPIEPPPERVLARDSIARPGMKASKKYKGRLIISPKAYGLTDLPDTSVERNAWRELRGDEKWADESTYVLHGLAKKSDPETMIAAMKEKSMTVRTSQAISAGKTSHEAK